MNIKQIKNYIVFALIVVGGLLTLWNQFNPETEQLELVENVGSNEGISVNLEGVDESLEGNNIEIEGTAEDLEDINIEIEATDENSDGINLEIEAIDEGINIVSENNDQKDTDAADLLFMEAQESIKNYSDVLEVRWLNDLDKYIIESYEKYDSEDWYGLVDGQATGTKAGGRWGNYDDQLPEYNSYGDEITYKEFDVNDKKSGQSRDAQRFVVASDGSVYLTLDHYDTYTKILK